jgi:hypothetical protein
MTRSELIAKLNEEIGWTRNQYNAVLEMNNPDYQYLASSLLKAISRLYKELREVINS